MYGKPIIIHQDVTVISLFFIPIHLLSNICNSLDTQYCILHYFVLTGIAKYKGKMSALMVNKCFLINNEMFKKINSIGITAVNE